MAASVITPMAFVVVYLIARYVVFPIGSLQNASLSTFYTLVTDIVLVSIALLTGYQFRKKFEDPSRRIFLTCAAASFIIILVLELVVTAFEPNTPATPSLGIPPLFASSAVYGIAVAVLITAGAAAGGRAAAKR